MRRSAREMSPSLMTSLASGGVLGLVAGALRSGQVTAAGPPSPPHRTVVKGCLRARSLTRPGTAPDTAPLRENGGDGTGRRAGTQRPRAAEHDEHDAARDDEGRVPARAPEVVQPERHGAHREGQRPPAGPERRSEEHTSALQSHLNLVCRLLLEKKNKPTYAIKLMKTTNTNLRPQ